MVWTVIVQDSYGVYKNRLFSSVDSNIAWEDACSKFGGGDAACDGAHVIALVKGNHPVYSKDGALE